MAGPSSLSLAAPGRALRFAAAIALAILVAACGLLPEVQDETASWSADKLYSTAHQAMVDGNYTRAVKLYEQLEARFPYGRYAQQAILESAYANYRAGERGAAVDGSEEFIRA